MKHGFSKYVLKGEDISSQHPATKIDLPGTLGNLYTLLDVTLFFFFCLKVLEMDKQSVQQPQMDRSLMAPMATRGCEV
jgi:hypothetical protein